MSVHEDALRDLAANHGWGFCDAVADEINDLEASYASLFKTHGELQSDLASAQEELERERMRLVACGVVAMANTPESAADARQIHEDYRSASLSDVERAVNAEMKLRTDLAAAQEWREAVLNELIVAHIYTKEHDTNPRKAIQDAITWNCQVALDPAVSSDAQKLIAAAQAELASVKAENSKLRSALSIVRFKQEPWQ